MKNIIFVWCAILFAFTNPNFINAQEYAANTIPDSLKQDATIVVRLNSETFTQSNKNQGVYKATKVVTILNDKGDDAANIVFSGDKFSELSSFSGVIRDASGKIFKKIKKGDLNTSSISGDMRTLVTDNYYLYYECKSPSYPYTIEYSFEIKFKNGILSYPAFSPIAYYSQSVETATYTLELPQTEKLRFKSNFDCNIQESVVKDKNIYQISAQNLKAISSEPLSPPLKEILPFVILTPTDFCFDSYCGDISTWEGYSKWLCELQKGRDILPADLVSSLNEMVKDAQTEKEKVKIIYEYLQKNYRYVSIQLGIGGLQPIDASTVYKAKFGDCKGLTNLMMAMLKAVGIKSDYCAIKMYGDGEVFADFTNPNSFNHVILLVPLQNDSIWLECTSNDIPFGYVHEGIAGHDALIIKENGGKICRLPSYPYNKELQEIKLTIRLKEDGNVDGDVRVTDHLASYDHSKSYFKNNDRDMKVKYFNSLLKFPQIQYGEIQATENRNSQPYSDYTVSFEAKDFANKTGSRFFVPICPLSKQSFNSLTSSSRTFDIYRESGYTEKDTIIIELPQSYLVENLPKDIDLKTEFGNFQSNVKTDGNQIVYTQCIEIIPGRFDKTKYNDLKDFYAQISAALKRKIAIKK